MNKTVKNILLAVGGVIAIALIIPLFLKKEFLVERDVVINKPNTVVFDYIKYLKNQNDYSTWAKMDPNMKKEFRGTDATVGFVSAWDSEVDSVGKGEQEIKKITEGQRIDYELRFIEPFESSSQAYMITDAVNGGSTKVKWGYSGKMPYPFNAMMLFCDMDAMMGKDLQGGLNNLKSKLETE